MSAIQIGEVCRHSLPTEKVNLIISETEKKEVSACSNCINEIRKFSHFVLEKKL